MEHELRKVGTSGTIMTIRRGGWRAASVLAAMLWTSAAQADVIVHIDKSSQRMSVSVDGAARYNWAISSGRDGLWANMTEAARLIQSKRNQVVSDS